MKREYNLDLLRICCCFLVVLMHSCSYVYLTAPTNSLGWFTSMILDYLGLIAVPIFYIISGYFILDTNKKYSNFYSYIWKKILMTICSFLFWSFIYLVYKHKLWLTLSSVMEINQLKLLFKEWISGFSHFWFLFYLLGLYFLSPIYKKIIEDKKLIKYYLILCFFIFFIMGPIAPYIYIVNIIYDVINSMGITILFGYSVYFIIGGLLKNIDIERKKLLYLSGIVSILFTIICNIIYSICFNTKGGFLCTYLQPFVFLASIATFVYFKNLKISNIKINNFISILSKNTMGIYFLHMLIYFFLTGVGIYSISIPAIFIIPILAICNFIISNIIVFILSKIPCINKYLV